MKATVFSELLLLCGVLALAYLVWVQQAQLAEYGQELDRLETKIRNLEPVAARAPARKRKETSK